MNGKKLLTLGVIVALLSGCNIVVRVGEGGSVMYGDLSCGPNEDCIVTVTDFLFSEVFEAKPADGYEFVGWRKRDRGLCGGSDEPCALNTRDLPRNNAIRGFLNSDEENFFLVAQFSRTSGGSGSGSGGASACFNREMFSQGTQGNLQYRVSTPGERDFDTEYGFMVVGQSTFNGQQALEVVTDLEQIADGILAQAELSSFSVVETDNMRVRNLGSEIVASAEGFTVTTVVTHDPYSLYRYDLAAGESYEDRYTSTVDVSSPQFPPGFSQRQQISNVDTYTFMGVESLTIAAGTYNTCHWRFVSRGGGFTETTDIWQLVEDGVIAKQSSDGSGGIELLPGSTLNGRTL